MNNTALPGYLQERCDLKGVVK